jgi:hypothetical protein
VQVTLVSSFGIKKDFCGSKKISVRYFSGTFHSYYRGILASFLIDSFYFEDTPVYVGGKNSLASFAIDKCGW